MVAAAHWWREEKASPRRNRRSYGGLSKASGGTPVSTEFGDRTSFSQKKLLQGKFSRIIRIRPAESVLMAIRDRRMQTHDSEEILALAQQGDPIAWSQLVTKYQTRLRRMINVYLDSRLSARVDASDVVQEVFICAAKRLPDYLKNRPVDFYPWLRGLVRDELIRLQRHHLYAQRRTIHKEQPFELNMSGESVQLLANHLISNQSSPSQKFSAGERRSQVHTALEQLPAGDREILLMRCLEQLHVQDIAEILQLSEAAAKSRLRRAFQKISQFLND